MKKVKLVKAMFTQEEIAAINTKNIKLEEENKKLKADTEHTIKFNNKIIGKLKLENDKLKEERDNCLKEVKLCYNDIHSLEGQISDLEKENKSLKERLDVLEKAKFEVMAYINMCHPTTYIEAEKLQKRKELFERIYNEKLYFLEKENNELKEEIGKLVMKH